MIGTLIIIIVVVAVLAVALGGIALSRSRRRGGGTTVAPPMALAMLTDALGLRSTMLSRRLEWVPVGSLACCPPFPTRPRLTSRSARRSNGSRVM